MPAVRRLCFVIWDKKYDPVAKAYKHVIESLEVSTLEWEFNRGGGGAQKRSVDKGGVRL